MSQRLSLSAIVIVFLAVLASVYFAFAAIQGPSGVMRRIQLQDETKALIAERDALQAEVEAMKNLTYRLSDEYLDPFAFKSLTTSRASSGAILPSASTSGGRKLFCQGLAASSSRLSSCSTRGRQR